MRGTLATAEAALDGARATAAASGERFFGLLGQSPQFEKSLRSATSAGLPKDQAERERERERGGRGRKEVRGKRGRRETEREVREMWAGDL